VSLVQHDGIDDRAEPILDRPDESEGVAVERAAISVAFAAEQAAMREFGKPATAAAPAARR